jgi:hypothetical protein
VQEESGSDDAPVVRGQLVSQSKDNVTSVTPAPKLLVVSFRATSVLMSLLFVVFCCIVFFGFDFEICNISLSVMSKY